MCGVNGQGDGVGWGAKAGGWREGVGHVVEKGGGGKWVVVGGGGWSTHDGG